MTTASSKSHDAHATKARGLPGLADLSPNGNTSSMMDRTVRMCLAVTSDGGHLVAKAAQCHEVFHVSLCSYTNLHRYSSQELSDVTLESSRIQAIFQVPD